MTTRPEISSTPRSLVCELNSIIEAFPFRGEFLSDRMGTYAAHALDVIERQAGLDADLEQALSAIEDKADGRVRWVRVIGHREVFIVFRDLSMIAYREPCDPVDEKGLTDDELMARAVSEEIALGRPREYSEGEMLSGLLPVALTLDLGLRQQTPSDVILKPMVDKVKEGGESLAIIRRQDGQEDELKSPVQVLDLFGPLRTILQSVEERIEHLRAIAIGLPDIRRPLEVDIRRLDIHEFETDGIYEAEGQTHYWPPYLSRPASHSEDADDIRTSLQELGEMALWACPDLPDELTLTLLSSITCEGVPDFSCDLPSHHSYWSEARRNGERAIEVLRSDFAEVFQIAGYDIPVGHRTGFITPTSPGATGAPIATIEVTRPNACRALEIDQEYAHSFNKLPGYVHPQEAADQEGALMVPPHPLGSYMAERKTSVRHYMADTFCAQLMDTPRAYTATIAGGVDADLLRRLVARAVDNMHDYRVAPESDGFGFAYSMVAGDVHDEHMRRPIGFITVSGILDTDFQDQIGGQIEGHDITTYSLDLSLDRLELAPRRSPSDRQILLSALAGALAQFLEHIRKQGEAQGRHFEIDVRIGRSLDDWHGSPITEDDLGFMEKSLIALRGHIIETGASKFVSLAQIERAQEESCAA